ncbi:peroxisomal carrier protein [Neocallimastix lanati (nom. inval.)]|uniref:Peroxisomal carrier protein n=1 Tax=Neocallimastix californiae TaxID=1754190 RepID=A0A1Y2AWT8_9FUNG|nr:peroxisomal carrier protein [Neocallimastix sp. JGI-2020a]ORY27029.1 peroxisomal carrier protein [Neocallimastix californiae]|eukprot:ORY27029.1 peroxisomal carrier protein [Neocallimastix californiae]
MSYRLSPFENAIAGSVSSAFANTITYPLDIAKTRLQVQTHSQDIKDEEKLYKGTIDCLRRMIKEEGFDGLYSGLFSSLFGTVASSFAYFFWYSLVKKGYYKQYPKALEKPLSMKVELFLGGIAGIVSHLCTLPISVVTTRQQTTATENRKNFINTIVEIVKEDGITSLWKGLKPSIMLTLNPSITYSVFERIKSGVLENRKNTGKKMKLSSFEVFIIGAFAKTVATVVTYPLIMAKIKLQWKPAKKENETEEERKERLRKSYNGIADVLKKSYKANGIPGLYQGMQAQILKAVLTQAILFVSKEKLNLYTYYAICALKRHVSVRTKPVATPVTPLTSTVVNIESKL